MMLCGCLPLDFSIEMSAKAARRYLQKKLLTKNVLNFPVMSQQFYKLIENKFSVLRSAACFGMELSGEERLGLMADTLIGAVIHIDEIRHPVLGNR